MAVEKPQKPAFPKGQFLQILLLMGGLFILLDTNLRTTLGEAVGVVLDPVIGFHGKLPVLTILLVAIIMVILTTLVRHFFVDWVRTARTQNTMRAFQRAMREARTKRDAKRIEQLQKVQPKLMGLQAELSSSQMKPMGFTFLIVIPLFAWLTQFVVTVEYPFFSAPWNPAVDMFSATLLPHWLLFYTAISIPFGVLVQRGLKFVTWRDKWPLMRAPAPAVEADAKTTD